MTLHEGVEPVNHIFRRGAFFFIFLWVACLSAPIYAAEPAVEAIESSMQQKIAD